MQIKPKKQTKNQTKNKQTQKKEERTRQNQNQKKEGKTRQNQKKDAPYNSFFRCLFYDNCLISFSLTMSAIGLIVVIVIISVI